MNKERAFELIKGTLDNMRNLELLEEDVIIDGDTILLGDGSPLDSIGFVSFITELEERLIKETNQDLYIVLDEVDAFNANNPSLVADVLAKYIVGLTRE